MATRARRLAPAAATTLLVGLAIPLQAQDHQRRRVLAVNVMDHDGNQKLGLTAADFRGEFHGHPVKILSAALDTSPRGIAVVVDASGSMVDGNRSAFAWSAAEDLVLSLTPGHRLALVTLSGSLRQHSVLLSDRQTLLETLAKARAQQPWGPSSLFDGVVRASRGFSWPALGDVVYLITDGRDTTSRTTESEAKIALARTGVRVFVVLIPTADMLSRMAEHWTERIAEATGGFVLRPEPHKKDQVVKKLRPFYPLITEVYRLEVEFAQTAEKPREWTLEVVDTRGKKLKNVQLVYPRLLVPSEENR